MPRVQKENQYHIAGTQSGLGSDVIPPQPQAEWPCLSDVKSSVVPYIYLHVCMICGLAPLGASDLVENKRAKGNTQVVKLSTSVTK